MGGNNKRVVIVGGGIAGALLAKHLQFHAHVTLVDPKEYFNIVWAALRAMVDPSFAERSLINYSEFLPQVTLITSSAGNITDDEVITVDGHSIPYDYLVIATGHVSSDPITRSQALRMYEQEFDKIRSSSSIFIVGGGPTGVELAGEIADHFPNKEVTLVHRGPRLLQFITPKASQKALEWLKSRNVEVLLNQTVDFDTASEGVYQTSAGETIVADCYFKCIGTPLGSSWLHNSILKDCLDTKGRLIVDKYLRVDGRKNIFAIGDITNIPELKEGFLAMKHADVTAKNLKTLFEGGTDDKLAAYNPGRPITFVSLGKKDAIAQINSFTFSGCLPGLVKSGDLFVGRTRKTYGLKPN